MLVGKKAIAIEPLSEIAAGMLEQMAMFNEWHTVRIAGLRLRFDGGLELAKLAKRWLLHPRVVKCRVTKEMLR